MTNLTRLETFESMTCCRCAVPFAMTTEMMAARRQDGDSFFCPNGHSQHFTKTEEQRLRSQLESVRGQVDRAYAQATHERDQREAAERSNAALRGVITKAKKRAAAGVCQCCQRTFPDVAAHMASKHPNYGA